MDPWDDLLEEGRRRVKKDPWADLQAEGTARAEARNKPNRDAFAATLAEQSKPAGPMTRRKGIVGRGDRILTRGNDIGDLTTSIPEPSRSIGNMLRVAATDPGTREGRAIADRMRQDAYDRAERGKRALFDVAAMPLQAAIGSSRNAAAKADALTKPLTQSHDEILRDLREASDPRGRSWGGPPTRTLDKARETLDEAAGSLMEQGGPLSFLQAGANFGGNMATEVAAFRGSGKAVGGGLEAGSKLFEGLPIAEKLRRLSELSKVAQATEGAKGVGMRAVRDLAANLPVNTINASDRDLSAAGGFADIGAQFGGDKSKGLTGLLDQISQDPTKRQLFENAIDVGLGGGIDALLTGAKGLRGINVRSSTKASEELAGRVGEAGRERFTARRRVGDETFLPTDQTPSVTVEPGARNVTPEELIARRRATPISPEQEALIAEATKRVNTPQGPEPLGPEQFLTRNAERPKATPEEVEAFLNRKKPEVPQGADPEVPANPDSWEALQAEGLARANAVTPPEQISQPPEPGFPEGRPVPRDENIPDPPVPEFEAPLHQGPYRDVPEIGTTTYRGRTKYLGDKRWAYTPTEKLEQHHAVLLQRIQTASDLEGEGARTYVHDDGWDKPKTGFVPTNDFGRGKRMGDEAQRILQLLETELKGRYNAMPPEELAARPGLVNMIFSEAEDLKPGDMPEGVWEPIPETPNALPGEEGFIDASPRNLPATTGDQPLINGDELPPWWDLDKAAKAPRVVGSSDALQSQIDALQDKLIEQGYTVQDVAIWTKYDGTPDPLPADVRAEFDRLYDERDALIAQEDVDARAGLAVPEGPIPAAKVQNEIAKLAQLYRGASGAPDVRVVYEKVAAMAVADLYHAGKLSDAAELFFDRGGDFTQFRGPDAELVRSGIAQYVEAAQQAGILPTKPIAGALPPSRQIDPLPRTPGTSGIAADNLFGDENIGRTGQQEMFGTEDLTVPKKPLENAPGGGAPELPGKISAEEMAARPELRNPDVPVAGANDPGQETLFHPVVRDAMARAGQAAPPSSVPVAVSMGAPGPVGVIDLAAAEAMAAQLEASVRQTAPINRVSAGPADPTPVTRNGRPIPKGISTAVVRDAAAGTVGAIAGWTQGDDTDEKMLLAAGGAVVGAGASRAGTALVKAAKSLGKTPARSSMQRVVKSLAEGFDIPTREGTRWWGEMTPKQRTKAEGYLTTGPGKRIIRLRHAADVMTMFHEIGHLLETDFTRKLGMTRGDLIQGSSQQMLTELYGMGRALYPAGYSPDRYIAEGFAEWVRRYATGQDMDAIAPEVSPFIRQMLDANPKGKAALDAAKLEFAQHLAGTPEERALLQMTGSSSPASKTTEFQRNWYDRNVDIRNALEDLGITPEVKKGEMFTQNAYSLARAAAKANAVAEWALHHGVADLTTGKYLTKPLMSVFEALGPQELDEFRNYLYAERVLELQDRFYTVNVLDADGNPVTKRVYLDPVQTGMHPLDAKNIVATHREKYEDLAKTIWEHQAAMIDLRVEAGMMSPRQAQIMKEVNSKHVPLYADLDPLTHKLSGQGVSAGRLHKIKTYYGDRKDLLGSIINDTFRTYRQTMQHKATLSLVEMASRHPEGSKILTILDHPPVQRVDVDAQAALRQLADLGWPGWEQLKTAFERSNLDGKMGKYLQANAEENALANAQTRPLDNPRYTPNKPQADIDDANALVEAFQNLEGQTVHEYSTISRPTAADRTHLVMPVVKDGKQVWVQVNNVQLYDALNGIGQSVDLSAFGDAAFRIAKGMTSVFRQSATLTPAFIKRNPIRDLGTALRRTQNERFTMVGEHLIRGLGVMLNHYANTVPVHGELPPPGASRVLAQIGRQADAAARAAMRTGAGPALLGAGIGAAQGDTTDERIALGLTGAAAGLGVHGAAKVASKDVVDLYEMWMQNGGGGVSLAGLDVADPKRTINEMMRSPLEKRMVIAHPVEALRAVAQMSEVATRLGELQIVLRQQLRKGTSLGDAKAAALYAAAEVTQDFTKGGKIGMALNQVMPFFNASLVGKGDLIRDMKDPSKLLKMFGWLTVPSLALYALQHDDPEYQDAPQYEKDAGWVVIFPPKPIRDLGKLVASGAHDMSFLPPALSSYLEEMGNVTPIRYVIPKPFESGVLFGSVPERVAESVFKQNPSGTGGLDYKVFDMLTNLVQPGSLPPMLGTAIDLARNKDFTGREIVPSYLQNRPAEDQATNRTGETARTIAGATGVPAAQIEQGVTGVLGPMAQVPLNISDAAIRKVREKQGKPPMRTPPRGGYTTVPTNWNRSFGKGELSGNGEAVEQFYETLKDAKGKWSSYGDEPAGTERKQELAKDPLVQMYRTGGQGSLRESEGKMKKLRERKRLALANNDTEAAKAVDREITLYARKVMQEVARASQRD